MRVFYVFYYQKKITHINFESDKNLGPHAVKRFTNFNTKQVSYDFLLIVWIIIFAFPVEFSLLTSYYYIR